MRPIETERLILRQLESSDVAEFKALFSDPEVMRFIGPGVPRTDEQSVETLRLMGRHGEEHGFGLLTVIEKDTGEFVGRCGCCYLDQTPDVEVGYTLAKAHWGKGYATEGARASIKDLFDRFDFPAVLGITHTDNKASQRVLLKSGLQYVGPSHYYGCDVRLYRLERPAGPDI